jgi:hypothetical protein
MAAQTSARVLLQHLIFPLMCHCSASYCLLSFAVLLRFYALHSSVAAAPRLYAIHLSVAAAPHISARVSPQGLILPAEFLRTASILRFTLECCHSTSYFCSGVSAILQYFTPRLGVATVAHVVRYVPFKSHYMIHAQYIAISSLYDLWCHRLSVLQGMHTPSLTFRLHIRFAYAYVLYT